MVGSYIKSVGYIENNIYYFYLRDHLGSTAVTAKSDGTSVQMLRYYPYGKQIERDSYGNRNLQPYKFGGKEDESMHGLGLYDFHNRQLNYKGIPVWTQPDQHAESYYDLSPYMAMAGNPVRFTDPTGMWIEDENGNLVAEDKDSQETLAKHLNTTEDIALQMMVEQLWLFNPGENDEMTPEAQKERIKSGNATLGERLYVGGTTEDIYIEQPLGFMGNNIRDQAGSDFSKAMYTNYAKGGGDIELSGQAFAGILMFLKKNQVVSQQGGRKAVSFYSSPEYSPVFGTASVFYNDKGQVTGIYDVYDFDSKKWGERSFNAETKTRAVQKFSPSSSKPFTIYYGNGKSK